MYEVTKEELLEIIQDSSTIRQCIERMGFKDIGRNRDTFFKLIKTYGFDDELDELRKRTVNFKKVQVKIMHKENRTSNSSLFTENSKIRRVSIRRRIIKENLIPYKCAKCGNKGEWQNKDLSLQLEHKNGVSNDHRLENLEFLCPNCHSQTATYAGRNVRGKLSKVERIKFKKEREAERIEMKEAIKVERIAFLDSIDTMSFGWVAKVQDKWGVSHSQVKRWIKKYYPDLNYYERN